MEENFTRKLFQTFLANYLMEVFQRVHVGTILLSFIRFLKYS